MRSRLTALILLLVLFSAVDVLAQRDPFLKWLSKKPKVKDVIVDGNEYFSDGRIKKSMRSRSNGFWESIGLRSANRLKKDSRRIDLASLTYLYRSNGFLFAKIEETFEPTSDSTEAIVRVSVIEGPQTLVRMSTSYDDLGSFKEDVSHLMRRHRPGEPVNPYFVSQTAFDIKTVYANSGYPYATVKDSVVVYPSGDSADVLFTMQMGPITVFGDVFMDSLKFTKEHTFTREVTFKPGDKYSRKAIIESRQRVYSTGLASFVDLSVRAGGARDSASAHNVRPDFSLKDSERMPKFAKIKTGAGQDEGEDLVWDLGLEFGNRNISGRGRRVRFEIFSSFLVFTSDWRVIEERFVFDYTEPWMFKIRMPLHFQFAVEPGIRAKTQDYRVSRIDLGLSTTRDLSLHSRVWSGLAYETVNITGIPPDQTDALRQEEGISVQRKFELAYELDSRNNLLLPIDGYYVRVESERTGGFLGGDNHFVKIDARASAYQNISGSNVYAWQYRLGWAVGTESIPYVPTIDRLYLGGAKTIRGYRSNEIGPKNENGSAAGGHVVLQTNQEIRRPLFWKLWGSTFVDIGNNYDKFDEVRWDNLLISAGIGLQYISPVGPVRIDYGHRLVHPGFEEKGRFHLSILYAF